MKKIFFPAVALAAFGAVACSDANTIVAPDAGGLLFSHSAGNLAVEALIFDDSNIRGKANQVQHNLSGVGWVYATEYEFSLCTEISCEPAVFVTDIDTGDQREKVIYEFTGVHPGAYFVKVRAFVPGATNGWGSAGESGEVVIPSQGSSKQEQTITFTVQAEGYLNEEILLSANADSDLPVGFSASGSCSLGADGVTLVLSDVGTNACTVTASQAGDENWHPAPDVVRNISIRYRVDRGGFLEPLTRDRIFRAGSTLPVKFQLRDYHDVIVYTATATISVARVIGAEGGTGDAETISGKADAGVAFRYSTDGELYIFNLGTNRAWSGTYRIAAALSDGTSIQQDVQIQR